MSLRLATPNEVEAWKRWLSRSHGLPELPNAVVYYCDVEFPMLITPWAKFEDFAMRMERDSNQFVASFLLTGEIRTIAQFWSSIEPPPTQCPRWSSLKPSEARVHAAAAKGLIWWGTEYPPESGLTTSLLYWFRRDPRNLADAQARLQPDPPSPGYLMTNLDLI
jgi:hypothetical protein